MLKQILDAHGGTLPEDVIVSFQNTGKEMPETLDFIQECSDRWNVPIVWLEYRITDENKASFEIVNHNSASRHGEPFTILINKRGYLPNPIARLCTGEMKVKTVQRYAKANDIKDWEAVLGLRADEPRRVARLKNGHELRMGCSEITAPMAEAGHDVSHVSDFWNSQPFDLNLPNINGKTPLGNCDLCFLKGAATIAGIIRERPDLAVWWAEAEAESRASKPDGAKFRKDRMSYAEMLERSKNQGDFFAEWPDEDTIPCMCTD